MKFHDTLVMMREWLILDKRDTNTSKSWCIFFGRRRLISLVRWPQSNANKWHRGSDFLNFLVPADWLFFHVFLRDGQIAPCEPFAQGLGHALQFIYFGGLQPHWTNSLSEKQTTKKRYFKDLDKNNQAQWSRKKVKSNFPAGATMVVSHFLGLAILLALATPSSFSQVLLTFSYNISK